MSGIEVAGLVLAVMPLIVEAAKMYSEGLKPFRTFFSWEDTLNTLIRELKYQDQHFQDNLEKLLRAASVPWVTSDGTEDKLYQRFDWDTRTTEAVNAYVQKATRLERLTSCLDEYDDCLVQIASSVKNIRKPKGTNVTLSNLLEANIKPDGGFNFRKRVTVVFNQGRIEEQIKRLRTIKADFSEFVNDLGAIHMVDTSDDARLSHLLTAMDCTRRYMQYMLSAFKRNWTRGCNHSHRLLIHLDPRQAKPRIRGISRPREDEIKFSVLVSHQASQWMDLTINGITEDPGKSAWSHASAYNSTCLAVAHGGGQPSSPEAVADICKHAAQGVNQGHSMSLGLSPTCQFYAGKPQIARVSVDSEPHSLASLLQQGHKLVAEDYCKLALTLATSMLQIQHSHCTDSIWTVSSIEFFARHVSGSTNAAFDLEQPYFCQHFHNRSTHSPPDASAEEALLELGLILLSLVKGQSFESWAASRSMDTSDRWIKQAAAQRWHHEVREAGEIIPDYSDAVSVCIKGSFEGVSGQKTWENEDFRRAICRKVIRPLVDSCSAWKARWAT